MMEGMGQRFLTAAEKVWRVLVDLSPGNHYQYTTNIFYSVIL
jgi:hypothetical protein